VNLSPPYGSQQVATMFADLEAQLKDITQIRHQSQEWLKLIKNCPKLKKSHCITTCITI